MVDAAPAVHDALIAAVLSAFRQRFAPHALISWVAEADTTFAFVSTSKIATTAIAAVARNDIPNVGIEESDPARLILIDAATVRSPMDEKRRKMLARTLGKLGLEL